MYPMLIEFKRDEEGRILVEANIRLAIAYDMTEEMAKPEAAGLRLPELLTISARKGLIKVQDQLSVESTTEAIYEAIYEAKERFRHLDRTTVQDPTQ